MKRIITIAAIAMMATAGATWAHDRTLGSNEDLYQSQLLEHTASSRGGEAQKGAGDLYGSHLANLEDVTPDPAARPDPIDPREALHEQDPEGYGIY